MGAIALLGAIAGGHCWGEFTLGAIAGRHCWTEFTLGAIAGVPLLGAIAGGSSRWVPLLGAIAGVLLLGAIVGCHGWMPLLDASYQLWRSSRWVPLLGAMLGCHCSVPLLGCHGWVPLREKIDQGVTPFSAAPFSTLITHKLACAICGLWWYSNFFFNWDLLNEKLRSL